MPKFKQPASLAKMALDGLVTFFTNRCIQLSAENSLGPLRHFIACAKEDICTYIPWQLAAEFYKKFLEEFDDLQNERTIDGPDRKRGAVLEIIMDKRIIGLRCDGPIMACLDPREGRRLHGLRVLDLSYYCKNLWPLDLNIFHLHELTTLIFIRNCTDADLKVIGQNCPNLEFIDVANSEVTDRGLCHLGPCLKLRFVVCPFCSISYNSIVRLLSEHTEVTKLAAWPRSRHDGFDCFSHSDLTAYPSIHTFTVELERVSDEHLQRVVVKFPNLIMFGISGNFTGDLCTLKTLHKLMHLDLTEAHNFTWENLKELLRFIGANICGLRTSSNSNTNSYLTQSDLDFVYEVCEKIEHLKFDFRPRFSREKLIIPPFGNLKDLICRVSVTYYQRNAILEFGELLNLKNLTVLGFYVTAKRVESMILCNRKFPNLKAMHIGEITDRPIIDRIRRIVKRHNLDLKILRAI